MAKENGGIIGVLNTPSTTSASGVWAIEDQYQAKRSGTWPLTPFLGTNSLRFNSGSTDNLTRTPASASNRKTWTWSGWVKRSILGSVRILFSAGTSGTNDTTLYFGNSDDKLIFFNRISSSVLGYLETNQLFRDVSAWYHIVAVWNSNNATAGDRMRLYVNGSEITSFASDTNPSLNENSFINNNVAHYIGNDSSLSSINYGGYLSEVNFIDGQALTPSSFGASNASGVWYPIPYTGSYGTNGFNLKFGNSASLGTDSSPNGNNFTVNNLTSVDQSTDSMLNNFSTLNSLNVPASNLPTFSEGNLKSTSSTATGGSFGGSSTFGVSTGKWYIEAKAGAIVSSNVMNIGVTYDPAETARTNNDAKTSYEYVYIGSNGYKGTGSGDTPYGNSYTTGDIIGIALDLDNNKLYFSKNGVFQNSGDPTSGATGTGAAFTVTSGQTYSFYQQDETGASANTSTFEFNFGSPPYAANGYADAAGYGNFSYAVPSGYYSLCTKNLNTYG